MLVTLGVIALLVIAAAMAYGQFFGPAQTTSGGGITAPVGTSGSCQIAPSIAAAVVDANNLGTAITPTANYRINGVFTGTTAPTYAGTADIMWNTSGYLNTIKSGVNVGCGANQVTGQMKAYTNSTLTYYSNDGLTKLVLNTANETVAAAGGSYNWKLHMQGVDKKSTGKQLLIVELSVPANVSSVALSGGSEVAVPNGYSKQATNGYVKAFLLPSIDGNVAVDYNLQVAAASAKLVQGTVYTSILSVEPFVETDGTFSDSGLAYNSLNVAKFHDSQTKNFIIA